MDKETTSIAYPLIDKQSDINNRKCIKCNHSLFTKYDSISKKYYCLPHNPNKKIIVDEKRRIEDILYGVPTQKLIERREIEYILLGID